MFTQRLAVLMLALLLAGLVLIGRLAQVQFLWHDQFDPDDYARAGGDQTLETVRGGIYARWGTPLAREVPSFDLAVQYDRLLLATPEPWRWERVRKLTDEFLRATEPAGAPEGYRWDAAARPVAEAAATMPTGDDARYEQLWSRRDVLSRRHGSLEQYVRRRLAGESARHIGAAEATPAALADWCDAVSRLTGRPRDEMSGAALEVVKRVERIRGAVARNNPRLTNVRVIEQNLPHVIAEDVSAEAAAVVRAAPEAFPGITVLEGTRRENLNGSLAPHVVGQVARISPERWRRLGEAGKQWTMSVAVSAAGKRYRMDDRLGVSGMELACEDLLRGRRGYVTHRRVFRLLGVEREATAIPPGPGCDVYLTIREDMQQAASAALARAAEDPGLAFSRGALVLLDVRDGAVLAAATWPSYDLTTYRQHAAELADDLRAPLIFRPTQGALPTGSVYKVVTAIAALEAGAVTPQTTFTCEGTEVFGRRRFSCTGIHGTIPMLTAIEKSCNIYFYNTGLAAGGEALTRWGRAFGLGMPTGVDLPFERAGHVPDARSTYEVVNLSIGQGGLLATPLQVAGMMAAVANGGRVWRPHFFDHARDIEGRVVRRYEPESRTVVVRPETLATIREGMRRVVESGTANEAGLSPFRAAGKSGTAELAGRTENHAWFAGYAPFENPKVAFAVVSELSRGHGGSDAAPIVAYALEPVWDEIEQMP